MVTAEEEGTRLEHERLPAAVPIRITVNRKVYKALAINLSEHGLCLRTKAPISRDSPITVRFPGPVKTAVSVKGVIRWVFDTDPSMDACTGLVAGIYLDDPDDDYLELLSEHRTQFVDERTEDRIPHAVFVTLNGNNTPSKPMQTLNIGYQGLFIRCEEPVTLGTKLDLSLTLPFVSKPVVVQGEVIHRIDVNEAIEFGIPPGLGLRIPSFKDDGAQIYRTYIDFLKDKMNL
jgi:hypothetical protein